MTDDNIYAERNDEEKDALLSICKSCENFQIEDHITKCAACACNISVLILYKTNSCPVGKW